MNEINYISNMSVAIVVNRGSFEKFKIQRKPEKGN